MARRTVEAPLGAFARIACCAPPLPGRPYDQCGQTLFERVPLPPGVYGIDIKRCKCCRWWNLFIWQGDRYEQVATPDRPDLLAAQQTVAAAAD